jgi:putative tryptophan/tyrosine transport system substrate-binding protein
VERSMHRREVLIILGATAAAWPLRARAQSAAEKSYRLGYLALLPGEDVTYLKLFSQRLRELGYSEAKNVTIEYRSAEGRPERLGQLAAELMQGKPDVLVAGFGTVAAKAAAAASKLLPWCSPMSATRSGLASWQVWRGPAPTSRA